MSFIGKLFSSEGATKDDPWPDRAYASTEALRDWWVVDCWFHKRPELAAAHYDGFMKWVSEQPPDSIPYLSWAPYTKLRVDLSCLRSAPTQDVEKQFRGHGNRYYVVAYCYARNEHTDIEQYQSTWRQSEAYEAFARKAADPKSGWPTSGFKVTPEWYHTMSLKTAGAQWVGYRGFEERKLADIGG